MDTVMCSKESFASLEKRLVGYPVIMVKVTCPVEEMNRRELARGDREIGLAAGQANIMVPQKSYDLIVDTHERSIKDCADLIIKLLADFNEQQSAFDKHQSAFVKLTTTSNRWANAVCQHEMI